MATAKEVKKVKIVVDAAESASGIPRLLERMAGVTVVSERLESGDYIPGEGICVERKTGPDLVHSILDGRLLPQIEFLAARFARPIVVMEGVSMHETYSGISEEALHGALTWMVVLKGISVVFSRSAADTAALLYRFAVQSQHGLGYEIPLNSNKPKGDDTLLLAQYVVEGLPGVGPGRAKGLIRHFGSARAVMAASQAELAAAPGMGPKTAEKAWRVLNAAC